MRGSVPDLFGLDKGVLCGCAKRSAAFGPPTRRQIRFGTSRSDVLVQFEFDGTAPSLW